MFGLAGPQAQQARIESNEIQAQHYIEGLCGRGVEVMICILHGSGRGVLRGRFATAEGSAMLREYRDAQGVGV